MRYRGILLLFFLLILILLFIYPKLKYLSFLSPQGTLKKTNLSGNFDNSNTRAFFNNNLISPPFLAKSDEEQAYVLGATNKPKRIEIDSTNQRIHSFEDNHKIFDFL